MCGTCLEYQFVGTDKVIICMNKKCNNLGKRYAIPTIKLKLYREDNGQEEGN